MPESPAVSVPAPPRLDGAVGTAMEVFSKARRHVRTRTRSATYFEHAERFAKAFLGGPLGVSSPERDVVGIDIPVLLDDCYEAFVTEGGYPAPAMSALTERLQRVLEPEVAAAELPGFLRTLDSDACTLVSVASAVLAATTLLGRATVAGALGSRAADDWVRVWSAHVWRHNRQQQRHSTCCLLIRLTEAGSGPADHVVTGASDLQPQSRTFRDGVREYVATYADTAAGGMALVGALPFAAGPAGEAGADLLDFFGSRPQFLEAMNQLLRFAQDVRFDPLEPLSAGVFALAAERRCSVAELDARALDGELLTRLLRSEWQSFADEQRSRLTEQRRPWEGSWEPHSAERLSSVLGGVLEMTWRIAEALTRAPHKA